MGVKEIPCKIFACHQK